MPLGFDAESCGISETGWFIFPMIYFTERKQTLNVPAQWEGKIYRKTMFFSHHNHHVWIIVFNFLVEIPNFRPKPCINPI